MNQDDTIFVTGHKGMVGSAILRRLKKKGFRNVLVSNRDECDLARQDQVESWFGSHQIDHVFLAAARVGGIRANNTRGAEFIQQNLAIQTNVIHSAWQTHVKKLLFLGSSCIYPRDCPQPIKEEYLLTGPLERTNESYAIAKIAGLRMVQAYNKQYGTKWITLMPTNLYGANDNFDPDTSHVLAALVNRFTEAVETGQNTVTVWGTGTPRREFLHSDDLAEACLFCMQNDIGYSVVNVGSGEEVTIRELAELIARTVGYQGRIEFDPQMPDGTPRKLLDSSRINTAGWRARTSLTDGLDLIHDWYREQKKGKVA
jgi:GDP-L-fucose synthase